MGACHRARVPDLRYPAHRQPAARARATVLQGERSAPSLWWGKALVVGEDNRVSTSKTAEPVWTYSLAAALLLLRDRPVARPPYGFKAVTSQGLDAQYALLVGGPLERGPRPRPSSQLRPPTDPPRSLQRRRRRRRPGENDSGSADLGDLEYALFNVAALIFFDGEMFRAPNSACRRSRRAAGLTSVWAVGFVGKKAGGPGWDQRGRPGEGRVGRDVKIATAGIIEAEDHLRAVTAKFGSVPASPVTRRDHDD